MLLLLLLCVCRSFTIELTTILVKITFSIFPPLFLPFTPTPSPLVKFVEVQLGPRHFSPTQKHSSLGLPSDSLLLSWHSLIGQRSVQLDCSREPWSVRVSPWDHQEPNSSSFSHWVAEVICYGPYFKCCYETRTKIFKVCT